MTTTPLGHFEGIPDDFIRAVNQRFRELEAIRQPKPEKPAVQDVVLGGSELETEGAIPMVSDKGTLEESGLLATDIVRGAPALTTTGRIPKNTATDGQLTESSLSDNGTTITATEPIAIDLGALSASQLRVTFGGLGMLALMCLGSDNETILFDCDWNGTTHIAKGPTAGRIRKTGGHLRISWATGLTVGVAFTFQVAMDVDLATGKIGFGGNTVCAYEVDVTGQVNASLGYRIAGASGVSGTVFLAKLTPGGANGSISYTGGLVTGVVTPT